MKSIKILAALAACGMAFGTAAIGAPETAPGHAPGVKHEEKTEKHDAKKMDKAEKPAGAKVGEAAPAFTLTDTDGKSHNLSDFKGKTVVLEWFNPQCPFIVKHHKLNKTFAELYENYNSKDVVFIAINSSGKGNEGNGAELNKKFKGEWKIAYPILLDESGTVGKAYGARTTPHVFVIDSKGIVAYNGAIDNNKDAEKAGDKNYVKAALDAVLAGKPVAEATTQPYGCSVKYAN